ncbi:tail fiber protein [Vibrio sp. ZSDZ65]|uniref:Tail fiber protein n=1 Tax=Vibrio qingdaonensis TaxID=2829491 RepID=A0A9X3CR43_9VIBR|nr:tail fiber protein [Vibrio qingdaonensis]MCW8347100.1 tail fiber protein [Vibrio qingdaonensis]
MATEPFLGTMMPFGGDFTIRGWAMCRGALLDINQNQALYAVLGTYYGGDGRVNMGLPDLQGRSPVGFGVRPGGYRYLLGTAQGREEITLAERDLPRHTHDATFSPSGNVPVTASFSVVASGSGTNEPTSDSYLGANSGASMYYTPSFGDPTLTEIKGLEVSGGGSNGGTVDVAHTGAATARINVLNPQLAVNWLMAINGAFPTRN